MQRLFFIISLSAELPADKRSIRCSCAAGVFAELLDFLSWQWAVTSRECSTLRGPLTERLPDHESKRVWCSSMVNKISVKVERHFHILYEIFFKTHVHPFIYFLWLIFLFYIYGGSRRLSGARQRTAQNGAIYGKHYTVKQRPVNSSTWFAVGVISANIWIQLESACKNLHLISYYQVNWSNIVQNVCHILPSV